MNNHIKILGSLSFSLNNFQCRIKEKEKEKEICTKMNNQYMFVCPKCLETYSSNVKARKKCTKCGTTLNEMPISVYEWRSMNDVQKENYKRNHLFHEQSARINKTESDVEYTKICSSCGKELPDDSQFCQYCGSDKIEIKELPAKMIIKCCNCGRNLPEDSSFCQYCGSSALVKEYEKAFPLSSSAVLPTNAAKQTSYNSENKDGIPFLIPTLILVVVILVLLVLKP